MAFTISARKRADTIRAQTLRELTGYVLAVDCTSGCGRRRVRVQDLGGVYGFNLTLNQAIIAMRCRSCGEIVANAELLPGPGMTGQPVPVWGKAAF
jgi:hypothetical protein